MLSSLLWQCLTVLSLLQCAQQCCSSPSASHSGNWQDTSLHRRSPKLACACWCLWASTSTDCILTSNMVRHDICWHYYTVERGLVVGFCGQPHYCNRPYYPTARFWSPSSYMVSAKPFPNGSRSMSCKLAPMAPSSITFLWLWPATDREPHCRHIHWRNLKADWIYSTKRMMTRSYGWSLQRL